MNSFRFQKMDGVASFAQAEMNGHAERLRAPRRRFMRSAGMAGAAWALGAMPLTALAQHRSADGSGVGERGIGACSFDGEPCRITGNAADTLRVEVADPRFYQYVGKRFRLDSLFDGATWAEGPAWLPQQNALVFSDVKANRMYRWTEETGTQTFRVPSYFANGNAVDPEGNLITCEHGRRGISRTNARGEVTMLVDRLEGKRLNSPNDVVVKSDGTIWFSDPPYGIINDAEGKTAPSEMIGCYVYCYDPAADRLDIATVDMFRPNGLAFSPDEKHLYVAEMSSAEFAGQGRHELVVFDVDGSRLKNRRVLARITPGFPDGLTVDRYGVIYCSCENGLVVLLPDGKELGRLVLDKRTSNCTFSAPQTLFITASNSLYRLRMNP